MAESPVNDAPFRLISDVEFGEGVIVHPFTNVYGCSIGDESRIGPFVEIQAGARIGARCKVQSHTFVCTGVEIGDDVFVGHGVVFINDKLPRSTTRRESCRARTTGRCSGRSLRTAPRSGQAQFSSGASGSVRAP